MDQQATSPHSAPPPGQVHAHHQRGRSPSAGHQQPHIRNSHSHSPSPHPYHQHSPEPSVGLGLGIDAASTNPPFTNDFSAFTTSNTGSQFMTSQPPQQPSYSQQGIADTSTFDPSFTSQPQPGFSPNLLAPEFSDSVGDFSLFPPATTTGDQFNASPLFNDLPTTNPQNLTQPDLNNMTSPQTHHSPTPPHMLGGDPNSAHQSPSFNQHQFASSPNHHSHSRNASLGPEAAFLPHQIEYTHPQFQGHRRAPSEYSDISSAGQSPNLPSHDTFEPSEHGHSPMQRPQDGFYDGVVGFNNFSISDPQVAHSSRSPSHSPAISPRISPQQIPDMNQPNNQAMLLNAGYPNAPSIAYPMQGSEQFPTLSQDGSSPGQQAMAPPSINIDFAPNSRQNNFEPPKPQIDQTSLIPPDRGRPRGRQRAATDPYNSGGAVISRPNTPGSLSPHLSADASSRSRSGSESSARSVSPGTLSPRDRSGSANAQSRRRQSMSSVPNNVIALRLADPEYQAAQDSGNTKRVQKHPATFQCTLCPKRFTRAYNLRSHLRTHTDERPFVCTVCGKAFARQHDRKRHESLHSGEKKFVCKGDLKAGGQWGCGRRFARADALGRHFRSEAGRICIKPLLDEEMIERQRAWQEQRMQQNMQNMAQQQVMDPNVYPGMDPGGYALPAALLAQYPALAQINWGQNDMNNDLGNVEDDLSGRSSFDASDYEGDESGYVSSHSAGAGAGAGAGSSAGYVEGGGAGVQQNYGEMGYASDYSGR